MPSPSIASINLARSMAESGVDFSPRYGAPCPWCGTKARIIRTLPWEDATRIRFHRCEHDGCVLNSMQVSIKSIEVDQIGHGRAL